jgi:DNA-binding GntR family transcriptional regulator
VDNSHRSRIWHYFRAGKLTRAGRDVLLQLLPYGPNAFPSHQTLAERANCCVRTVQRALQRGRDLGLISWVERRVRAGWRWVRTSNRYSFHTTGQQARESESRKKKEAKRLTKRPFWQRPPIQEPVRTVAEQLAALGFP